MHLSYSKIKTYLDCPLKFKLTYIDRSPQRPKPYFKFSRVIHHSLHVYHFYGSSSSLDSLLRCYDKTWRASGLKSERLYQEGRSILVNFFSEFEGLTPWRVEEKFRVGLGRHILSGKIDRVDKENGRFRIIDYKMGKNIPSQEDPHFSLQLKIYSAAFYKLTKIVPTRASFYFLRHGERLSIRPTEDDIDKTIRMIFSVAGKIRRGNFLPNEGKVCRMCDYKDSCSSEKGIGFLRQTKGEAQLAFDF